jgi:predicted esterase
VSRQGASGSAGHASACEDERSDIIDAIMSTDPHRGQAILRRGPAPADARLTIVCIHGRGASAADILTVADELHLDDVAYLAPEAAGHTWYPYSFLAPLDDNQPGLNSALGVVAGMVADLGAQQVPSERVAILGFSQGACLSLEYAARHARRYAAIIAFSGGLIGPPGAPRDYAGSMGGTPVFIGCSDIDPHIPVGRVRESSVVFRGLGASVDERIYPRLGHTINEDEIAAARTMLAAV